MHLTNVSVQKTAPDYDHEKVCNSGTSKKKSSCYFYVLKHVCFKQLLSLYCCIISSNDKQGCKWQMQQLRRYLTAKHGREMVETLFQEMDNIFVRSLQSVQKVIINDKHCFELYGYDILLDQNLKP